MTEEIFIKELNKNNIKLTEKQITQFRIYCEYLLEYNKHTNLTAIKDKDSVYLKHFYDSAMILFNQNMDNKKVLDIGTGAGFPGIVLKIINPSIELTVLDSNNKKIKFIQLLTEKLNIHVNTINDRAENLKTKEEYDFIVSRAVAPLRILVELSLPLLKNTGKMIHQKSHIESELEEAKAAIELIGGNLQKVDKIECYSSLGERCLVIIEKIKTTPKEYPRKYDKILKYPLKINKI